MLFGGYAVCSEYSEGKNHFRLVGTLYADRRR